MSKTTITYRELADRLNAVKLFNKAPELDPELYYEGLENGTLDYCIEHDESERDNCIESDCEFQNRDIFQWYLISSSDADYLKRHTEELIFYSDVLNQYVWGITHFGTSWDHVELEITE